MRPRLVADVTRCIGALVVLIGLLVGVPVALAVAVGWPLPSRLPSLAELREALSGSSISDATIVKALALVCWVAWLQILAATVVEVHGWVRGRVAAVVPLGGFVQPLVRQLVVSALLLAGSSRAHVAVVPMPATHHVAEVAAASASTAASDSTSSATEAPCPDRAAGNTPITPSPGRPTYTVVARDSLWKLAKDHLGDPLRWKELFELNRGSPQPDGATLTDANLIRTGWVLVFPADAVGLGPLPNVTAEPPPAPSAPTTPEPAAQEPPVAPGPAVEVAPPPSPSVGAPPVDGTHGGETGTPPRDTDPGGPGALPAAVGVAGAGLLAAGLVVSLDRLRRVQQHRRRTGEALPPPSPGSLATERSLRRAAARAPVGRLDTALRAFGGILRTAWSGDAPVIEAVSVGGNCVEILLRHPVVCDPGPFRVDGAGRVWILESDWGRAERLAARHGAPAPALVPVGRVGDREVLIDLEAACRTEITGDEEAAASLFWSMAFGLATSSWVDDIEVVLVGLRPDGLSQLDRVRAVPAVSAILGEVEKTSRAISHELEQAGRTTTLDARLAAGGDTWTPTVVMVADPGADDGLDSLLRLANSHRGLCVVVAGDCGGNTDRQIVATVLGVEVQPSGLKLEPPALTAQVRDHLSSLLCTAAQPPPAPTVIDIPEGVDGPSINAPRVIASAPSASLELPAWDDDGIVRVRVMGPVDIEGGRADIGRRKSVEVVVFLALHRRGVDESRLKAALWVDELPTPGSFHQTISRARSTLGTAPDGTPYLPHLSGGLYRVSQAVVSDLDLLETALGMARAQPGHDTMSALSAALSLVRGLAFEGTKGGYEWAHAEGFVGRIETVAADAAHLLAEWHLGEGDTKGALRAAGHGLLASPACETLYRDRMRAHDLAANPAGVESVMNELCRVVETLEPYDSLHPETLALYEDLSRHRRTAGRVHGAPRRVG